MHPHRRTTLTLSLLLGLLLTAGVIAALGFAEEEIGFRDPQGVYYPPQADFPDERVSTFHDDLTLALALAAGFNITDSHRLRVWNQLVDSEALPAGADTYTYGNAGFSEPPNPLLACLGHNHARQVWPTGRFDAESSATTSRFGPFSPFFHYPHLGGADLAALHDWAWGFSASLQGYEAYAWGRLTDFTLTQAVENDGCIITRTVTIPMPVAAGSLEAFATYLHSLGDAYSHNECLTALAAHTPPLPWGTHTVPLLGDPSIPSCDYNPSNPLNDDAHGREFGSVYTETWRTIAAAEAIYAELSMRSVWREGVYQPLALSTPLVVSGTQITLGEALVTFTTAWDYDQPFERRAYVDQLVAALSEEPRNLIQRGYLPLVGK